MSPSIVSVSAPSFGASRQSLGEKVAVVPFPSPPIRSAFPPAKATRSLLPGFPASVPMHNGRLKQSCLRLYI
jgi:hypothetical protein